MVEDESRAIGSVAVPEKWHRRMQSVPLVVLEIPLETRVRNIAREYVTEALQQRSSQVLHEAYRQSLARIKRRLGGLRHREVEGLLDRGFEQQDHAPWIERLLCWYYDPMYDYQLQSKRERIVFRGDSTAVLGYLASLGS